VRRNNGKLETLHTLNGTAAALARSLVVIIENYQNEDGTLRIPEKLHPYMNGREMI
jgi:seryl-tRNA synthetase